MNMEDKPSWAEIGPHLGFTVYSSNTPTLQQALLFQGDWPTAQVHRKSEDIRHPTVCPFQRRGRRTQLKEKKINATNIMLSTRSKLGRRTKTSTCVVEDIHAEDPHAA